MEPQQRGAIVYRPRLARLGVACFVAGLLGAITAEAVAFLVGRVRSDWFVGLALPLVVAVGTSLGGMLAQRIRGRRDDVVVTPVDVAGPSRGLRVRIAISEIDAERTARRTWSQRLAGMRIIYARSGERIVLSKLAYTPADMAEILSAVAGLQVRA